MGTFEPNKQPEPSVRPSVRPVRCTSRAGKPPARRCRARVGGGVAFAASRFSGRSRSDHLRSETGGMSIGWTVAARRQPAACRPAVMSLLVVVARATSCRHGTMGVHILCARFFRLEWRFAVFQVSENVTPWLV